MWQEETMPEEWRKGIVCPVHKKKRDSLDCKNYRGISLLNSAYKILSNILFARLLPLVEKELEDTRQAFESENQPLTRSFPCNKY
jgi:hypothetical protein